MHPVSALGYPFDTFLITALLCTLYTANVVVLVVGMGLRDTSGLQFLWKNTLYVVIYAYVCDCVLRKCEPRIRGSGDVCVCVVCVSGFASHLLSRRGKDVDEEEASSSHRLYRGRQGCSCSILLLWNIWDRTSHPHTHKQTLKAAFS